MSIEATLADMISHWRGAASRGIMNSNTANSWANACEAVASCAGEGWENLDVRKVDVEKTIRQFQNLRHKKYSGTVLTTYAGRFRRAMESYIKYLEDPGAWRPKSRAIRTKPAEKTRSATASVTGAAAAGAAGYPTGPSGPTGPTGPTEDRALVIDYPFPLRPGVTVHLWLPRDLKRREIKRLTTFMEAVTADDENEPR